MMKSAGSLLFVAIGCIATTIFASASFAGVQRIALVSDPHVSVDPKNAQYNRNFELVIDDVNAAQVDAVLMAGDLTQSGDEKSMVQFATMVKRFKAPVRWVAGNHDIGNKPMPDKKGQATLERVDRFERLLGPAAYAVDLLPELRVVGVGASLFDSGLPAEKVQWELLEKELAAEKLQMRTVVLTHYPPFVATANEADEYFNINLTARRKLLDLLEKSNVTAVLSGHLHRPISVTAGRVPVVGAPAVSFGLPRGKQGVGWTLVTIDEAGRVTADNRYLPEPAPTTRPTNVSLMMAAPNTEVTSDRVHIFYYNWYGAPPLRKEYIHWQQGNRAPPDDIGSNYYPKLGAYDSGDKAILKQHMAWIKEAGVGTLCLTWWGRQSYEEELTQVVIDAAGEAGLKVNFHLEPYVGHTPAKLADDVRYLLGKYGKHPAFYRAASLGNKPIFYVFETVRHKSDAWKAALDALRVDSPEPVLIIAQTSDLRMVEAGGFDGGYPYDGLAPFKHPNFLKGWQVTAREFAAAGKVFIPSVGPGYWDDRAVPTGADEPEAARTRDGGKATTYDAAWQAAIATGSPFVTITSFNEWHEGSQIEPAVAHKIDGYSYPAYPDGETQYLKRTADWAEKFVKNLSNLPK